LEDGVIDYANISGADFQAILDAWARSFVEEPEDGMTLNFLEMSGAEFQRSVRDDPDKWADAAMASAEDLGFKLDRDWIRSLLADAMDAARQGSIRKVID
jgi:hypothetical protein